VVAVDGLGWDGERLGHRSVKVTLGDAAHRPNAFEFRVLCALEEEMQRLEAGGGGASGRRGKAFSAKGTGSKDDASLARRAQANVASALGIDQETVARAVRKAEAYYLRE